MRNWARFVKVFYSMGFATLVFVSRGHASLPSVENLRASFKASSKASHSKAVVEQELVELSVAREPEPNFDADLAHLASSERKFYESLPLLRQVRGRSRLLGPMKRISERPYR